jgi:SSS family transporter
MALADYIIILVYFAGLLVLGGTLGRKIKSSEEMFIAGRNSSWWLSGLSTYMTIFSAGTFVVWGGVAYRSGIVAIVIGVMLGIASIIVGLFLAGRWSKMQISSPAEYISVRFGKSAVRFYSVVGIIGRGVHMAVALYSVAIMIVALTPLPAGHILADPGTGHLSVTWVILLLGIITFIYTAAGGFVAVLMTDVIQFAVLIAMILIMVPLSFSSVGGFGSFVSKAPEHFFSFFTEQYSWGWMIMWCLLNIFMIGGDWPYVQRYISVPTVKDAKKSIFLVGALYFVTPVIWYVPSLVYRTINPDVNPEQSYMLMSQHVLGSGMLGIMLAAIISATLSTVSGTLNVFANVFTYDIFKAYRPASSDKSLMTVGRIFTYAYGFIITGIAVIIPYLGGAEKVVVPMLTLVISPLFIPSIWGLFSRRIGSNSVWLSMGITYLIGFAVKAGLLKEFVSQHVEFVDAFVGLVFPVTILLIIELILRKKRDDQGWNRLVQILGRKELQDEIQMQKTKKSGSMYSDMAFKILMGTYAAIGIAIGLFALTNGNNRGQMMLYSAIFLGISVIAFGINYFSKYKSKIHKLTV